MITKKISNIEVAREYKDISIAKERFDDPETKFISNKEMRSRLGLTKSFTASNIKKFSLPSFA